MGSLSVTLTGRIVTLTPLSLDDVPGLVAAASENRSTFHWTHVPDTVEGMARIVRSLLADEEVRTAVAFTTRRREDGEIVGMTRFLLLRWWWQRDFPDAAEIGGTFLSASTQRTAFNTEAKLLMLRHAFDVWGVQRLDLKTDERNTRARHAIERIGARFDGVLRNWQMSQVPGEGDQARSSAMYSILPDEWPTVRNGLQQRLK